MPLSDDYHFELGGYAWGIGRHVSVDDEGFDPGSYEIRTQDEENSLSDGVTFGKDYFGAPTWTWSLHTNRTNASEALASIADIKRVWRGDRTRMENGEVMPLTYRLDGRLRRVYGRPRRFASPPSNRIMGGYVPITCDFQCVDDLTYAEAESSVILNRAEPTSAGGFTFPIIFPAITLPPGERPGQVVSVGDIETWGIYEFKGPITNPWLRSPDWTLNVNMALGANQRVWVDTRPWVRAAYDETGGSIQTKLGRRTRLSRLTVRPGQQEYAFGGLGGTGAATCTVRWRDAWTSL